MQKILSLLMAVSLGCFSIMNKANAQNVGINTATPEAALDINGDVIFRTSPLFVPDGITQSLDINSVRFSYYRLSGPTADFSIGSLTAGIDGRLISFFNQTGFTLTLINEDVNALPEEMIVTGTNTDITIINKGMITLQYDGTELKWIVKSSSKGGVAGTSYWDTNGIDIYNNNSGNVGIGTTSPAAKLTIQTAINSGGWMHIGGADSIIVSEGIGGVSAAIGTVTNHAFRINSGGTGRLQIYPTGQVVVGTNSSAAFGKFTVETNNNSFGISHTSVEGNILATNIGGTSAGIGTFSFTNMRIFSNSVSCIFVAAGTGNVGIGTDNPTYKLAVNGNIRAKEIRVNTGWADYVFSKKYKLRPLGEVEQYILDNNRLPGMPAASVLQKEGVDISAMQTKMMEKIEELTLYLISANKTIEQLQQRITLLEKTKQ